MSPLFGRRPPPPASPRTLPYAWGPDIQTKAASTALVPVRRRLFATTTRPNPPTLDSPVRRYAMSGGAYYVLGGQPYQQSWNVERAVTDGYERVIWVVRAMDAIASAASRLPILFRDNDPVDGKLVDPSDEPLWRLLNRKPNPYQTAKAFRYKLSTQLLLSKQGVFIEVWRARDGTPKALYLLPPHQTAPIPDPRNFVSGYRILGNNGQEVNTLPPERVLWIRREHPIDPYLSMTPMESAGISIDLDYYIRLYNRNFMANDGRPGGVLSVEGGLSPEDAQELKARFSGGPVAAGRTTVLEGGKISYADTATSPRDAQWVAAADRSRKDILMAFGVPETLAGDASATTFDNADAEEELFWRHTMAFHLGLLDDSYSDLTATANQDFDPENDRFAVHDTSSITVLERDDRAHEARLLDLFKSGLITGEEFRAETGRDPDEAAGLRVFWIPGGALPFSTDEDALTEVMSIMNGQDPNAPEPPPELPPGDEPTDPNASPPPPGAFSAVDLGYGEAGATPPGPSDQRDLPSRERTDTAPGTPQGRLSDRQGSPSPSTAARPGRRSANAPETRYVKSGLEEMLDLAVSDPATFLAEVKDALADPATLPFLPGTTKAIGMVPPDSDPTIMERREVELDAHPDLSLFIEALGLDSDFANRFDNLYASTGTNHFFGFIEKAGETKDWDPDLHPRDRRGRFARVMELFDPQEADLPDVGEDLGLIGKLQTAEGVQDFLADFPRGPTEELFKYQARVCEGLNPDVRHAVLFAIREHYAPNLDVQDAANRYRASKGLPAPKLQDLRTVMADRFKAAKVAQAYVSTPDSPNDPAVIEAYDDFKRQNEEMFDLVTRPISQGGLGIMVDFTPKAEPYPSAEAQAEDVRQNHHLSISTASVLIGDHSIMSPVEYNHFRAVHDLFGHVAVGGGFDRHGEYQAWVNHNSMYTGPGRKAMSTEYHGQNSTLWNLGVPKPKAILLPDDLIENVFDEHGNIVRKGAWYEIESKRPFVDWDEHLHPRNRDGKFRRGMRVMLANKPGGRGRVAHGVEVIADEDDEGMVRVQGPSGVKQKVPAARLYTRNYLDTPNASSLERLAHSGGFTYSFVNGRPISHGDALSPFKLGETKIPYDPADPATHGALRGAIKSFVRDHKSLLSDPKNHLGGWYHDGNFYLDISVVVDDDAEARDLSVAHDQLAYYRLDDGKEVWIGGKQRAAPPADWTGEVAAKSLQPQAARGPVERGGPGGGDGRGDRRLHPGGDGGVGDPGAGPEG